MPNPMYYKTVIFLSPTCFRTPRRASFYFGMYIVNHHIHGENILKLIEKHRPLKRSADQLISLVCRLLSVSRIMVEEAKFDLHKIQNPDVESIEYQQGPQYGFDNLETTFSYLTLKTGSAHGHARGFPPIKNYVNPTDK